jgi:hypothetical protein
MPLIHTLGQLTLFWQLSATVLFAWRLIECAAAAAPAATCWPLSLPAAGRFAFVEFRTEELATTAMTLDKTELCGRQMNIGRPKGYVPGTSAAGAGGLDSCH